MIKVIHVISDTNIGGAGTVLLTTLYNIDRSRFDVKVVLPEGSALIPRIDALGFETVPTKGGADKSLDFAAIHEYMRIFKREKPDIVHTHAAMAARIAAWLCGVKVRIHTRHSTFAPKPALTRFPLRQLCGFVNNTLSTEMIAVSESAKANLVDTGANPKKIEVIINGAEPLRKVSPEEVQALRQKLGITDDDVVVGMSARLEEVKGHIYLIEAARILRERGMKNLRVLIIGTGATEGMLKAKVREYALEDCVIFAGFVSDVAPYIEVMDAIINCSFGTEATSMALIEAMSLAKPAIATDYGGNAYIVENGKNGYIIPQKSASNLADAITKLFADPARLAEMSKVAYSKYICRLTGKIMTGKVEKLYEEGYAARCKK
ncbi:MAG: glycosyltransferase family 1 protein [Oscillospiraceae bacterium]|nr:MAG: glycosyltransferase family 1 protein [Oscillospiraceae bacterium]